MSFCEINYDKIIKIDPTHKEVWLNKGVNLFMLEKYEESIKYYNKVLSKVDNDDPMYPKILHKRGMSYDDVRDYWKDLDKQSYYADNFRMEKAEGGIMNLKKR